MPLGTPFPARDIWPDDHFGSHGGQVDWEFNQNNTQGYDTRAPALSPARRDAARGYANGSLNNNEFMFPLFVQEYSIDTSLAGSIAQSRFTRDFYPRNFVQPHITVTGQCLDQADYGGLCNFVHHAQRLYLGTSTTTNVVQLEIAPPSIDLSGHRRGGRAVSIQSTRKSGTTLLRPETHYNQSVRGKSQHILVQGYIATMPQEYRTGEFFPMYQFDFVVAHMIIGPYSDSVGTAVEMSNWLQLLTVKIEEQTFTDIANTQKTNLIKEGQGVLAWAQANSANIINTTNPYGSSANNNGSTTGTAPNLSGNVSRSAWAKALLQALGDPTTQSNIKCIMGWEAAEGTTAKYNPLATTLSMPNSSSFNSAGVQNYTSWDEGITATVNTLTKGIGTTAYGAIRAQLQSGNCSSSAFASAVVGSVWGTKDLTASLIDSQTP